MNKNSSMILLINFKSVIFSFDVRMIEKPHYFSPKLPRAFAWDYFHKFNLLFNCLIDDMPQFLGNRFSLIEDGMEVEFEFGHN